MRKIFSLVCMAALLLMMGACRSDEPVRSGTGDEGGGPEIAVSVGNGFTMASRSAVTSSEAVQHIEHVYAYVFEGTGNDATGVWAQELGWEPKKVIDAPVRSRLKYEGFKDNTDYTVLVIGVDNNGDTYNFPFSDISDHGSSSSIEGKTLNDAMLSLASGKGGEDMRYTEVFAGMQTFTKADVEIEVDIQRCVAGVLCYLKDIPAKHDDYRITGIRLVAKNAPLNTQLPLAPSNFVQDAEGKFWSSDFIGNTSESEIVLAQCMWSELGSDWESWFPGATDSGTLIDFPAMNDGSVSTLEGSVLLGAYLLPVETKLAIQLLGDKDGRDSEVLDGIEYTVSIAGNGGDSSYKLSANHIYSIGTKKFSDNTDGDQPASLQGGSLILEPVDWNGVIDDVLFPSVSLTATMSFDKPYNQDNFIFNCIGTEDEKLTVHAEPYQGTSIRSWTLSVEYEDNTNPIYGEDELGEEKDWIYFKDPTTGNIVTTVSGSGSVRIPDTRVDLVINDFVRRRNWSTVDEKTYFNKVQNDYRTAYIVLTQTGLEELPFKIKVRQYNAITAGNYGFSRLDWGGSFDRMTGEPQSGTKDSWGFGKNPTSESAIYGSGNKKTDSGYLTVLNTYRDWYDYRENDSGVWQWSNYSYSALYKTIKEGLEYNSEGINSIGNSITSDDNKPIASKDWPKYENFWFLPTDKELLLLFSNFLNPQYNIANIALDELYWSCLVPDDGTLNWYNVLCTKLNSPSSGDYCLAVSGIEESHNDNKTIHYFRQARNFLE